MANLITVKDETIHVGDTVRIYYKFKEADKLKQQIFSGILISIKGSGNNKMFTVRKTASQGIGVERIFPVISPFIEKVKLAKKGSVKRAKLYFLRKLSEKELKEKISP